MEEFFISVDVETSGPEVGSYALLAIGACTLEEPRKTFYLELNPDKPAFEVNALAVSGLSMEKLAREGMPASDAMQRFADWILSVTPAGMYPLFVGFNAPFDWMFINEYFFKYIGENPFGHAALDIKSFFMGLKGVPWSRTGMASISEHYLERKALSHNALEDAIQQAEIFRHMLTESRDQRESRMKTVA